LFLENRLKYYNNGVCMLRTTPVCLAWLVVAVMLHPSPASAVNNRVKKVKTLYKQLFFDDATKVCRSVLDAGHNRREDLIELLKYKGLLAAVQGNSSEATKAFRQLLVIEPGASLGEGHPPRVERAFAAAQRWFRRQRPLTATPRAPASVLREGTVEISLEVTADPLTMVSQAVLHIRAEGTRDFKRHLARSSAGLRWAVRLAQLQGIGPARRVEYYVTLLDRSFNEVGQVGSAAAPRPIALLGPPVSVAKPVAVSDPAPPPPKERRARPWYKRWWVWAAVGAAVVTAAAVGGAVAAANSPSDTVDAPVTLEATGP
jgi:hypothetical protein